MTAAHVLMCPPRHYGIRYAINPWMLNQTVNHARATTEFEQLVTAFADRGLAPVFIEPDPELPDMVFTANAGLVVGDTFVSSRFRYAERHGETVLFAAFMRDLGYDVAELPPGVVFEGAGDALFLGPDLVVGSGFRSAPRVARDLQALFPELNVIPVGLSNPYFYHLDTCFSPLPSGRFIYYPDAFDDASRKRLEAMDGYWVTERFCLEYGCNMVAFGDVAVTGFVDSRMEAIASKEGLDLVQVSMLEFKKAGGGVRCLSLPLRA